MSNFITTETQLETLLAKPSDIVGQTLQNLDSDLLILGVGGKMGPTLAWMAAQALAEIKSPYQVYGVARFSQPGLRAKLTRWGVKTIACDMLDQAALAQLPDCRNVIFMAGQKFGTTGNEALTWALNTHMPALVADRFRNSRIVIFSTGNIYPLTSPFAGAPDETFSPNPVGEYANSCLGRERIFEYFSQTYDLRCAIMRLNYAIDLRYGVLLDIAQKVKAGQAIDVTMGAVNIIWQGDANAQAIALLDHCATPPFVLNVTGPEIVSIRWSAQQFGQVFGVEPTFVGDPASTALLSNAAKAQQLFGYPQVSLQQMIDWTAHWVEQEGATLNKPTSFNVRDGRF